MSFGGVLLAMSAVQAVNQIGQGYAQKAEANYNATIAEGQANLIDTQKEIEFGQYQRLKGQTVGKSIANIAAAGIDPTGSAAAVMSSTLEQINIDQAYGQFNLEQEKQYKVAEAETYRRQGKQAVYSGYSGAFSTMLRGAADYATYKGGLDLSAGAKNAGKG